MPSDLSGEAGQAQGGASPHCPQQNGMVERVIRTLKEQCAHRHRFESLQHASRVIGDWISFYNRRRPHQALKMKTPAEAFALAARPVQVPLGQYRLTLYLTHKIPDTIKLRD